MIFIILGSKSDLEWGKLIGKHLEEFGVNYKTHIASAHKTPEYLLKMLDKYNTRKEQHVYICVAGRSNALGGFVDANVTSPVVNCPPESEKYSGLDILSSLRMPTGVAPLTVLEPDQAALAAVKILALNNKFLREKINKYQHSLKDKIIDSDKKLRL